MVSGRVMLAPLIAAMILACARGDVPDSDGVTTTLRSVRCTTCRIAAESVTYVPDRGARGFQHVAPAVDSRGNIFARAAMPNRVEVLDPAGSVIAELMVPGADSSSVRQIWELSVGDADTLFISAGGYVHVYSPTFEYVRRVANVAPSSGRISLGPLSRAVNTASAILPGNQIVRIGSDSSFILLGSDGSEGDRVALEHASTERCMNCGGRIYRESTQPNAFWSSRSNRYAIEQHDLNGKLLARFVRDVDWFREWSDEALSLDDRKLQLQFLSRPSFLGARQTSDGLLWAHARVMDERNPVDSRYVGDIEWITSSGYAKAAMMDDISSRVQGHFMSRIEVIDPATKELLASETFPYILIPLRGEYSVQLVPDSVRGDGWNIYRLRLLGRG